jgi:uncharacterized protein (UPF0335 family)
MTRDKKETNGPTDEQITEVVDAIEREAVKLVTEKMEYMRRCKPIHEQINDIVDDAVASMGFNKKALKIKIKQRSLERKARDLESEIDIEVAAHLKNYAETLGDFGSLPLGQAAMDGFERSARDPLADLARGQAAG